MVQIISPQATPECYNLTTATNYSLICTIDGAANLRPQLTYEWSHFNGTEFEEVGTHSSELHFSPVKLSEAGEYICTVNISSSLLNSDLIISGAFACPIQAFGKLI